MFSYFISITSADFLISLKGDSDMSNKEILENVHKRMDKRKKFIKYSEAEERYGLGITTLRKMANDCNALYKVGKSALINVEIFDEYMESFKV